MQSHPGGRRPRQRLRLSTAGPACLAADGTSHGSFLRRKRRLLPRAVAAAARAASSWALAKVAAVGAFACEVPASEEFALLGLWPKEVPAVHGIGLDVHAEDVAESTLEGSTALEHWTQRVLAIDGGFFEVLNQGLRREGGSRELSVATIAAVQLVLSDAAREKVARICGSAFLAAALFDAERMAPAWALQGRLHELIAASKDELPWLQEVAFAGGVVHAAGPWADTLKIRRSRLQEVLGALQQPAPGRGGISPFSVAVVANLCVRSEAELLAWPWLTSAAPALQPYLRQHAALWLYLVDQPHCASDAEVRAELVAAFQPHFKTVRVAAYRGGASKEEHSAIFSFLAERYAALPDFTVFLHPDAEEHQSPGLPALGRALMLASTGSSLAWDALQFYPLGTHYVADPRRAFSQRWLAASCAVLGCGDPPGTEPARVPRQVGFYAGTQTVARRDVLLKLSRVFYGQLAADPDTISEVVSELEAIWHIMYGEPWRQPLREKDSRLPLFLKWGVPTKRSNYVD